MSAYSPFRKFSLYFISVASNSRSSLWSLVNRLSFLKISWIYASARIVVGASEVCFSVGVDDVVSGCDEESTGMHFKPLAETWLDFNYEFLFFNFHRSITKS